MITGHVFRTLSSNGKDSPRKGMCGFRGTCPAPESEHITVEAFRFQKSLLRKEEETTP